MPLSRALPREPVGPTTVILNCCVAVCRGELASDACTVKLEVPAEVGVPEICPLVERVKPAGKAPVMRVQVYGVAPPVAARIWLYGVDCAPFGSVVSQSEPSRARKRQ